MANVEIIEIKSQQLNPGINVNDYSQSYDEYIAAACWARQLIEKQPDATIGIISPKLNTVRDAVERAFQSVFSPGALIHQEPERSRLFSISLGKPLATYPMINTAMDLLSLSKRTVSLNALGNLLHSPFVKDASLEHSQRANFYSALRQVGEQRLSFKSLRWIYEQRCNEHEQCETFIQLLKTFEIHFLSLARQQSLREWAIQFSEWLTLFGWPGERELNSDEYQTLRTWQSTLAQLGSLGWFE